MVELRDITDSAGLLQPILLPREAKEERAWFYFGLAPWSKLYPDSGAWKLFCHLWFRSNLVDKTHQPQERHPAYGCYQHVPIASFTSHSQNRIIIEP